MGTGLQYFNARYYDPELGQFLSPDTLVPDPGNLFDYNRYMYTRGNPMRYNDPTGHFATLDNGDADWEGDHDCWTLAYQIYGYGLTSQQFAEDWQVSPNAWLDNIAKASFADVNYLTPFFAKYHAISDAQTGQTQGVPNPVPTYAPVNIPNPCNFWDCPAIALDLASLGSSIAQTSAVACSATGVGAPVCAPAAGYFTYVDFGLNIASVGYEGAKYVQGNSTTFDLSVTLTDGAVKPLAEAFGAGASATPGIGVAYDTFMLGYDIFVDPFVTTPGQAKVAR